MGAKSFGHAGKSDSPGVSCLGRDGPGEDKGVYMRWKSSCNG